MKTQELTTLIEKYFAPSMRSMFNQAAEKAKSGKLDDQFELGRIMHFYFDQVARECSITLSAEDTVLKNELLLEYFENLAEQGHVTAMRYTASSYANGHNDQTINRRENGYTIQVKPDFERAKKWASKAAEQGDDVARKIHTSLTMRR